jgi:hypothetical protein
MNADKEPINADKANTMWIVMDRSGDRSRSEQAKLYPHKCALYPRNPRSRLFIFFGHA